MESREMVQVNLFSGRKRDADVEDGHVMWTWGRGEEGWAEIRSSAKIYRHYWLPWWLKW